MQMNFRGECVGFNLTSISLSSNIRGKVIYYGGKRVDKLELRLVRRS